MNLRNLRLKGYEWFADVWADELLPSDIRALGLAGTEYEEVTVAGNFYISGPSTPEPTCKVDPDCIVVSSTQKWLERRLMKKSINQIRLYVEQTGDRREWAADAFEAKADLYRDDSK